MKDPGSEVPHLLDDLYERATAPDQWPEFLAKLMVLFRGETATIRLSDLDNPVIHQSYTTGFRQEINQIYEAEGVERDPFRDALAALPVGKALESTAVIEDRAFEGSVHYQSVFRPNGNFYALGTQFERQNGQAMHVGIHRPKQKGPFSNDELKLLELFSPHLRRVVKLSRMMADLNEALSVARHALDRLPFGVWYMDSELRVQWMNASAEEAFATNSFGLKVQYNRLRMLAAGASTTLRAMVRRLTEHRSLTETVKLGQTGACLLMVPTCTSGTSLHIIRSPAPKILCFLLDTTRPAELDENRLTTMYHLTPAEYRLANLLVTGLDVNEASAVLEISPHTGRTQLKSIMRKTGVRRQASLQRILLLCADTLRASDD
ncbi:helix-turn-helix transcriptional regulator [uncultured Marinobacter sp.]|uniref:helix-turn-helix transcriptional regulator n=1 Tax=uncultured Marinobacter sp. TaxID=187379 RepID=UPI0025E056EF|nr:helix-turn-helix transcriptional regulator [uncultured Marinobacter sp.]